MDFGQILVKLFSQTRKVKDSKSFEPIFLNLYSKNFRILKPEKLKPKLQRSNVTRTRRNLNLIKLYRTLSFSDFWNIKLECKIFFYIGLKVGWIRKDIWISCQNNVLTYYFCKVPNFKFPKDQIILVCPCFSVFSTLIVSFSNFMNLHWTLKVYVWILTLLYWYFY